MKLRTVVLSAVAFGLTASTAVYAAPMHAVVPVHAMFAKTKMVKLNLRNDSSAPMELKVGEEVMTIEAGKTVAVRLAVGTRVVANAATAKHQAGDLLAQITPELSDATIGIK